MTVVVGCMASDSSKDMTLAIDALRQQHSDVKPLAPALLSPRDDGSEENEDSGEGRDSGGGDSGINSQAANAWSLGDEFGADRREAPTAAEPEPRSACEQAAHLSGPARDADPRVVCDAVARSSLFSSCNGLRKRGGHGRWRGRRQQHQLGAQTLYRRPGWRSVIDCFTGRADNVPVELRRWAI